MGGAGSLLERAGEKDGPAPGRRSAVGKVETRINLNDLLSLEGKCAIPCGMRSEDLSLLPIFAGDSYMGVHVNLATKSGSNKVHGALYEFVRNDLFDAHPFFDTPGSDKQPLRYNQFGMEFDGPVYLPKLYDGRNKTFFMASYEGLRQIKNASVNGTALTPAMRNGDFSALLPTTQLFNPFTGLPFAGNIIPAQYMSPVSQALLKYIPAPQSGTTFNGFSPSNLTNNKTLERIDQSIGEKVRLFVRYDCSSSSPVIS